MPKLPAIGTHFVVPPVPLPFPLKIGRPASMSALDAAGDGELVLIYGPGDTFSDVGLRVQIAMNQPAPAGRQIYVRPVERVRIVGLELTGAGWVADVEPFPLEIDPSSQRLLVDAATRWVLADPNVPDVAAEPMQEDWCHAAYSLFQILTEQGPRADRLLASPSEVIVATLLELAAEKTAEAERIGKRPSPPALHDGLGPEPRSGAKRLLWNATLWARTGLVSFTSMVDLAMAQFPTVSEKTLSTQLDRAIVLQAERASDFAEPTQARRLLLALEDLPRVAFAPACAPIESPGAIERDLDEAVAKHLPGSIDGVVYFTLRSAMAAAAGQGLMLNFWCSKEGWTADDANALATRILDRIERAGLPCWWPRTSSAAIFVPIRWELTLDTPQPPQEWPRWVAQLSGHVFSAEVRRRMWRRAGGMRPDWRDLEDIVAPNADESKAMQELLATLERGR